MNERVSKYIPNLINVIGEIISSFANSGIGRHIFAGQEAAVSASLSGITDLCNTRWTRMPTFLYTMYSGARSAVEGISGIGKLMTGNSEGTLDLSSAIFKAGNVYTLSKTLYDAYHEHINDSKSGKSIWGGIKDDFVDCYRDLRNANRKIAHR